MGFVTIFNEIKNTNSFDCLTDPNSKFSGWMNDPALAQKVIMK